MDKSAKLSLLRDLTSVCTRLQEDVETTESQDVLNAIGNWIDLRVKEATSLGIPTQAKGGVDLSGTLAAEEVQACYREDPTEAGLSRTRLLLHNARLWSERKESRANGWAAEVLGPADPDNDPKRAEDLYQSLRFAFEEGADWGRRYQREEPF
jgi:hypothetical protein